MGFILSLVAVGVYQAIANAQIKNLERELISVTKTLHNGLELKLRKPGKIEVIIGKLVPDICVNGSPCFTSVAAQTKNFCKITSRDLSSKSLNEPSQHLFRLTDKENYYIKLLDLKGCLTGFAGQHPLSEKVFLLKDYSKKQSEIITDSQGNRYKQISLLLHTSDHQYWGYLQVGKSFKEFDDYLATVRGILFLGLPIALGLVLISSWYLAQIAMYPIYLSYEQIQQFTADAAHELKTPLTATLATVDSVLRIPKLEEEEAKDTLWTIKRQHQRLIALVQDLLLLSRLERQSVPDNYQSCCLNEIINDLVEELAALAVSQEIELTAIVPTSSPIYVTGNLEQLYRLVSNVMINAIKYTPAKGKILVFLEHKQMQEALIIVQDTGIGIAPQEQQRIFNRFYRVDDARSRQTGGSGLGLAIAQAIVKAHRGSIALESKLDKGSTFKIRLPIESGRFQALEKSTN